MTSPQQLKYEAYDKLFKPRTAVEAVFLVGLFDNGTGGGVVYANSKATKVNIMDSIPDESVAYFQKQLGDFAFKKFGDET